MHTECVKLVIFLGIKQIDNHRLISRQLNFLRFQDMFFFHLCDVISVGIYGSYQQKVTHAMTLKVT